MPRVNCFDAMVVVESYAKMQCANFNTSNTKGVIQHYTHCEYGGSNPQSDTIGDTYSYAATAI